MPHVVIIGTCDTKLQELLYLRSEIIESSNGEATVTLIDVSSHSVTNHEHITIRQDVLLSQHAPSTTQDMLKLSRGEAITYMIACAINCVRQLYEDGIDKPSALHGIIAAGGTGGTAIASAVMREVFPIGFPKLIVSTNASGDTGPVVGETDITMMYSVVDIAGTNTLLRRVLGNAAGAIFGMSKVYARSLSQNPSSAQSTSSAGPHRRQRLGLTMFGVTTPCVNAVRSHMEERFDVECFVFHCTGHGGKAMERLVVEGVLDGVLDLTTTEICDELMGGNMSAGPHRLEAALRAGLPYIVSVGATDMVNFGPRATVPEKYGSRKLLEHNPTITLMRTSADECKAVGNFIADKIQKFAKSPEMVQVVLPIGGVSMIATPDGPFYDKTADEALFETIEARLQGTGISVSKDSRAINDETFAIDIAQKMAKLMDLASK